jgi:hypothetical protein
MAKQLEDLAVIERAAKLEGKNMIMIVSPKANNNKEDVSYAKMKLVEVLLTF